MRMMGNDDYYYAWAINGCPNENGIEIIQNSVSSKIEISTPVFKFTDFSEVYFHATVKACKDNDCVSTCLPMQMQNRYDIVQVVCDTSFQSGFDDFISSRTDILSRLRRSALSDPEIMTIGPIKIDDQNQVRHLFPGN